MEKPRSTSPRRLWDMRPVRIPGRGRIESTRIVEGGHVSVLGDAVVGLTQPLHVAAREGEALQIDDGLVADVDVVHATGPVEREPLFTGTHHRDHPTPAVGEASERLPGLLALGLRPDGVGRNQADAAVDGVGDEAVAVEEPLLVAAKGEIVERSFAVAAHDVAGPDLRQPASPQATVDHGSRGEHESHHRQGDSDRQEARSEKLVETVGQRHRLHTHQTLHYGLAHPPQRRTVMVFADVEDDLGCRRGRHGDAHHSADQRDHGRAQ